MEVSTVSPLPASPTEGDDPCMIDARNTAIHSVTLLMGLYGLAGNGALLCLLNFNPITDFILPQAITDFLLLIFRVPFALLFLLEEVSCSSIMPVVYFSLLFLLSLFSYNMGLYSLVFISIERRRSNLCLFFCNCQLPERLMWVLMCTLFWAFFFVVITVNPTMTLLCQSHEQEHCWLALISMYTLSLFLFAAPMVISSTILFIPFKPGSQQEQPKRLDIVIFLTALFSLPFSLCNFLQQLSSIHVSSQVVFLLTCIHSSIKPFIYFLVGSWRRDCSLGTCWKDFSMKPVSMKSLREALQKVFGDTEENTVRSHDPAMDTVL